MNLTCDKLKFKFLALVILMVSAAISEYLILASIVPFINIVLNAATINHPAGLDFLPINVHQENFKIFFILFILLSGVMRILMHFYQNKFVYDFAHEVTKKSFSKILNRDYSWHKAQSSSKGLSVINSVFYLVGGFIVPIIQLLSGTVVSLGIITALLYVDWRATIFVIAISSIIYFSVMLFSRKKLNKISKSFSKSNEDRIEISKEAILGIRDVILNDITIFFEEKFSIYDLKFNRARALHNFLGVFPKYLIETLLLVSITVTSLIVSNSAISVDTVLPILLMFLVAAQKVLPLINQVFTGWTAISGSEKLILDVEEFLKLPDEDHDTSLQTYEFKNKIELQNIHFAYGNSTVLKDFNLTINYGEKVGIMGPSGSGKSTIMDLLSGLIFPASGMVLIDGKELTNKDAKNWWSQISYVSQSPFILNDTMEHNIVLNKDKSECAHLSLEQVVSLANLESLVDSKLGLDLQVGENGKNLSGGQKQRLAIARSLYSKRPLLIWDEATSALDAHTEEKILSNLPNDITMICISHSESALKFCDKIIKIKREEL